MSNCLCKFLPIAIVTHWGLEDGVSNLQGKHSKPLHCSATIKKISILQITKLWSMVFQHASRHVCLMQPNVNFLDDSCKIFIIEALDHRRSCVMRYPLSKIGIDEDYYGSLYWQRSLVTWTALCGLHSHVLVGSNFALETGDSQWPVVD